MIQIAKHTYSVTLPGITSPYHLLHILLHIPRSGNRERQTFLYQHYMVHLLYSIYLLLMRRIWVLDILKIRLLERHFKFLTYPTRRIGQRFTTQNWQNFCHLHYLLGEKMIYDLRLKNPTTSLPKPCHHGQNLPNYLRNHPFTHQLPIPHPPRVYRTPLPAANPLNSLLPDSQLPEAYRTHLLVDTRLTIHRLLDIYPVSLPYHRTLPTPYKHPWRIPQALKTHMPIHTPLVHQHHLDQPNRQ